MESFEFRATLRGCKVSIQVWWIRLSRPLHKGLHGAKVVITLENPSRTSPILASALYSLWLFSVVMILFTNNTHFTNANVNLPKWWLTLQRKTMCLVIIHYKILEPAVAGLFGLCLGKNSPSKGRMGDPPDLCETISKCIKDFFRAHESSGNHSEAPKICFLDFAFQPVIDSSPQKTGHGGKRIFRGFQRAMRHAISFSLNGYHPFLKPQEISLLANTVPRRLCNRPWLANQTRIVWYARISAEDERAPLIQHRGSKPFLWEITHFI